MITYNHKYRGPLEYEKFILNILSFHSVIEELETLEVQGTNEAIENLSSIHKEVDRIFNQFTGKNGICERGFILSLKERKCIEK